MKKGITNFHTHEPATGKADSLVILLHGVGSNGRDLISLAPYWAEDLPGAAFVSPDAPFPCDMVPPGYPNSYQWFSLQNRDPINMLDGVRAVTPIIHDFIDEQLLHYGLTADRLALVGFSQGTMTSLFVAPRYKEKIAGVLGYSGALLWDGSSSLKKMSIHLIHGEADDVVSVAAWDHAKETLEQNGFEVSGYTTPGLPHSIDERGIRSGGNFLKEVFSS